MMIDWNEIPRYRRFINSSYATAEVIAQKYRQAISNRFRAYLEDVTQLALVHRKGKDVTGQVNHLAQEAAIALTSLQLKLGDRAAQIGYSAQGKALVALDQRITRDRFRRMSQRYPAHPQAYATVLLSLRRMWRKIQDATERSMVDGLDERQTIQAIERVLPPKTRQLHPKRKLWRIKEAAPTGRTKVPGLDPSAFIPDDEWNKIVDDYLTAEIKIDRSPKGVVFEDPYDASEDIYQWQVERDTTELFVDAVRKGEMPAFRDAGVKDLIWLAVIDQKTDDCCAWRNGLTLTEIKAKLEAGDANQSENCEDGLAPPIHLNCRCRIIPATEDLVEPENESLPLYEEWLSGQEARS